MDRVGARKTVETSWVFKDTVNSNIERKENYYSS